jgi:hypothetical protein
MEDTNSLSLELIDEFGLKYDLCEYNIDINTIDLLHISDDNVYFLTAVDHNGRNRKWFTHDKNIFKTTIVDIERNFWGVGNQGKLEEIGLCKQSLNEFRDKYTYQSDNGKTGDDRRELHIEAHVDGYPMIWVTTNGGDMDVGVFDRINYHYDVYWSCVDIDARNVDTSWIYNVDPLGVIGLSEKGVDELKGWLDLFKEDKHHTYHEYYRIDSSNGNIDFYMNGCNDWIQIDTTGSLPDFCKIVPDDPADDFLPRGPIEYDDERYTYYRQFTPVMCGMMNVLTD